MAQSHAPCHYLLQSKPPAPARLPTVVLTATRVPPPPQPLSFLPPTSLNASQVDARLSINPLLPGGLASPRGATGLSCPCPHTQGHGGHPGTAQEVGEDCAMLYPPPKQELLKEHRFTPNSR